MKAKLSNPSRILVTRTDRIGDLVLSTPVFSELRKKFPQAWIACLTFVENRDIVDGNPYLDEVVLYDKKGSEKGWWGNCRFARKLASKKFDLVIHLHATNRMHWVSWLARIPVRIGWTRKSPKALNILCHYIKKEGEKHEAEYNFDLLKTLGISCPDKLETFFPVSERAQRSLENLLKFEGVSKNKPWIVLNPSASCPSKRWPASRFGDLIRFIAEKVDAEFFVIGTVGDRHLVKRIQERATKRVFDLTGRLNLSLLGALLKESALLISNDSGPVHIAVALGTPVVSIFGRKLPGLSPARWRPLGEKAEVVWKDVGCEKCLAHLCQIGFLCLDAISVEEVMEKAEKILGKR